MLFEPHSMNQAQRAARAAALAPQAESAARRGGQIHMEVSGGCRARALYSKYSDTQGHQ